MLFDTESPGELMSRNLCPAREAPPPRDSATLRAVKQLRAEAQAACTAATSQSTVGCEAPVGSSLPRACVLGRDLSRGLSCPLLSLVLNQVPSAAALGPCTREQTTLCVAFPPLGPLKTGTVCARL